MPSLTTTVLEVRPETADASTLRLRADPAAFSYRPGQYLMIDPHQFTELEPAIRKRESERGRPEGPGYFALSSDGLEAGVLEITVKAKRTQAGGSPLGPFLARGLAPGRTVALTGPTGRYCLPESPPDGVTGYLHLCAGGGVAPNRGMIRHALGRGWPQRHLLILQDKTEEDMLFAAEWADLERRSGGRFRLRKVYSVTRREYVSPELLRREMEGFLDPSTAIALVCGPNVLRDGQAGFVDRWCGDREGKRPGELQSVGFSPDRVLTERG